MVEEMSPELYRLEVGKKDWKEAAKKTAEDHVTWYLDSIKPLLIANFIHGFKHGVEYEKDARCNDEKKMPRLGLLI